MHIITTKNEGQTFYLRGTVWASYRDRATQYETVEQARAAIDKAKKFMHPRIYKAIQIVEVTK